MPSFFFVYTTQKNNTPMKAKLRIEETLLPVCFLVHHDQLAIPGPYWYDKYIVMTVMQLHIFLVTTEVVNDAENCSGRR